jgi:signal transduction histidine kinase
MGANCWEQYQQEAAERADGQLAREWVAAVSSFARTMAAADDWATVLSEGLTGLLDTFALGDAGAVFTYRRAQARLLAACALGYDSDAVYDVELRSGESLLGRVFQSGQAVQYGDPGRLAEDRSAAGQDTRELLESLVEGHKHPYSAICVPLVGCDGPFGSLVVERWHTQIPFHEADLQLATALGSVLSVAAERFYLRGRVEQGQQVLDEASKLQQDVMAALSHDMRTPLASIKGYATALLLDEVEWDPETAGEYLEIIGEECDHLSEIIADLLEASRFDAGQIEIEKEPTLLPKVAQGVVDEVCRRTERHRFLVSFPPGFPVVDADAGRIRRVLFNLLDNAVKYSAGGLVVVRGWVGGGEVFVSVADQGEGISPEHLNRLFERFFRVKFVGGQHVVGSGLGLPIARDIVELHGGRIWAESTLGEGTTMYFTLPLEGLSQSAETVED